MTNARRQFNPRKSNIAQVHDFVPPSRTRTTFTASSYTKWARTNPMINIWRLRQRGPIAGSPSTLAPIVSSPGAADVSFRFGFLCGNLSSVQFARIVMFLSSDRSTNKLGSSAAGAESRLCIFTLGDRRICDVQLTDRCVPRLRACCPN